MVSPVVPLHNRTELLSILLMPRHVATMRRSTYLQGVHDVSNRVFIVEPKLRNRITRRRAILGNERGRLDVPVPLPAEDDRAGVVGIRKRVERLRGRGRKGVVVPSVVALGRVRAAVSRPSPGSKDQPPGNLLIAG